ncbi:putative WRKY transcription factor 7 [Capsicum baccatum]|uniref:WRKY transcription factor 7 n=1 Tax=Capsicum baccatum TaxID=33114 RepID=A0A2G2UXU5_CAPBA|nr:putative WRKY transcription factor 7 [Capsicum baccatum]
MREIIKVKAQLSKEFEIKDLRAAKKILGMEIMRDREKYERSRSISCVSIPASSMLLHLVAQVISTGKQPSATGKRCREQEQSSDGSGKKRKVFPRKVIRTPVISSKITDIPTDECSWRKYGQKSIKGSPYPQ